MVLSLEEINVKMFNTALQASKLVQKLSNISYTELWSVPVIGFISREETSNELSIFNFCFVLIKNKQEMEMGRTVRGGCWRGRGGEGGGNLTGDKILRSRVQSPDGPTFYHFYIQ